VDVISIQRDPRRMVKFAGIGAAFAAFGAWGLLDRATGRAYQPKMLMALGTACLMGAVLGRVDYSGRGEKLSASSRLGWVLGGVALIVAAFVVPGDVAFASVLILTAGVLMALRAVADMVDRRPMLTIDSTGFLVQGTFRATSWEWADVRSIEIGQEGEKERVVRWIEVAHRDGQNVRIPDEGEGWFLGQMQTAMIDAWKAPRRHHH
jgi:hypothetical protein